MLSSCDEKFSELHFLIGVRWQNHEKRKPALAIRFTFTHPSIKMYMYIQKGFAMANTKLFKNGNSQAVRIPAELAYSSWDVDLVIERQGDELRIRPAQRRMGDVLGKLAKFSPDFMAQGRGENMEGERETL
jgi:antitoxin VapB